MIKKTTILSAFFVLFLTNGVLKGQDTDLGAGINSDAAFERLLDKEGLDKKMPASEKAPRDIVRDRAKELTRKISEF